MKVFFDDDIFSSQHRGGISRYFVELINTLQSSEFSPDVAVRIPYKARSRSAIEAGLSRQPRNKFFDRRFLIQAENRVRSSLVDHSEYLVHHTYYSGAYLKRYQKCVGRVSTIHDFTPELLGVGSERFMHRQKELYIQKSDVLVCVSETTKDDLLRLYGNLNKPVIVAPLGVSPMFQPPHADGYDVASKYFLFVGSRSGYKKFSDVIRALSICKAIEPRLIVVGPPPSSDEVAQVNKFGLTERVVFTSADDMQLVELYQRALALVFPSQYEGFGMPTLEAMASGCPVITSMAPALVEVGGGASVRYETGNIDALAVLMARIYEDSAFRSKLSCLGIARSAEFRWSVTAERTVAAYSRLLS